MTIDLTRSISPFSMRIKLLRGLWSYLAWPLVRFLPRWASPMRVAMLRLFGARIGPVCLIERGVQVWLPWQLQLDGYVAIGRDVELYNYGRIHIGRMSVVSQYSYLCTGTHDYTHPHMPLIWRDISIGSECWIAAGCFVGPGTTIGEGAVVAAYSVVVKDLPPRTVCGGNPCIIIKARPPVSSEGGGVL